MNNCYICDSSNLVKFLNYRGEELFSCKNCGFVAKDANFIDYKDFNENYFENFNVDRSREIDELLKSLPKNYTSVPSQIKILEIGCGSGVLLDNLQKRGFKVYGYEPSKIACEMANQKFGLINIQNGYFEKNDFNMHFNIIILYDVIEHLYKPFELFQNIRKIMNEDTLLVIKSGNPNSINARLYPPNWQYYEIKEHISFFSKKALNLFADEIGLQLFDYHKFKHAYGGINFLQLMKNIVKSVVFRISPQTTSFHKKHNNLLANDHFIAILKKN